MGEYIKRSDALRAVKDIVKHCRGDRFNGEMLHYTGVIAAIECIEGIDADFQACYHQTLWENDIMRSQLADIGKTLGAKMDDVRQVRKGTWEKMHGVFTPGGDPYYICPFCRSKDSGHLGGIEMPQHWKFCPVCGAELSEP